MDDNHDKIDFGPLDPARDRDRWEQRIQAIASRAAQAHVRGSSAPAEPDGWLALLAWWRPALTVAVALALALWVGVLTRGEAPAARPRTDPALSLLEWSLSGETPAVGDLLDVAGGPDEN